MKFNYIKNKMVLKCYICKFDADNKKNLEKHIKSEEHNTNLIIKKANMDDKDCSKCFKTFSTKGNKSVHELKCKGTLNYNECEYCHKIFVSPSGKSHHRKICKQNPVNITINGNHNTIDNSVTINNITNNITNITIQRNAFKNEDLSYMTKEEKYKFIAKCVKDNFTGLISYIKEVFLNNAKPENNTIRKVTNDFTECYDGEKWCIENDKVFLDDFIEEIHEKFDSYLFEGKCKHLESIDLYNFMLKVGIYLDFGELSYKDKPYNREQFPIEKSKKDKVRMNYIQKILQEITEKSKTIV